MQRRRVIPSKPPAKPVGNAQKADETYRIVLGLVLFGAFCFLGFNLMKNDGHVFLFEGDDRNYVKEKLAAAAGSTSLSVDGGDDDDDDGPFSNEYPVYELHDADTSTVAADEADELAEGVESELGSVIADEIAEEKTESDDDAEFGFIDQAEYDAAPYIDVPPPYIMKQQLWWALKPYEKYHKVHPMKLYVPRLNPKYKLTREVFHERFRRHGLPVIINFESLRHYGWKTHSFTFDELQEKFPYNEKTAKQALKEYKANGLRKGDDAIDLGPGIASIVRDEKLSKKGRLRNFPRNLKVKEEALADLDIEYVPLLPVEDTPSKFQMPTIWMGTSTSDTRFHHDCCDNFVLQIAGTKRFTLAPPTDWRTLSPICVGNNKSLCWAKVASPNAEKMSPKNRQIMSKVHKMVVDVKPGELLYMPAGLFHHVANLGPTVMVNMWTKQSQQCGLLKSLKDMAAGTTK